MTPPPPTGLLLARPQRRPDGPSQNNTPPKPISPAHNSSPDRGGRGRVVALEVGALELEVGVGSFELLGKLFCSFECLQMEEIHYM